jgi:hypothetical protein
MTPVAAEGSPVRVASASASLPMMAPPPAAGWHGQTRLTVVVPRAPVAQEDTLKLRDCVTIRKIDGLSLVSGTESRVEEAKTPIVTQPVRLGVPPVEADYERTIPKACGFEAATQKIWIHYLRVNSLGSLGVGWHRQTRLTVRLRSRLSTRNPTGKRVCPCHPGLCLSRLNRYFAGMTNGSASRVCQCITRSKSGQNHERNSNGPCLT